MKDTISALKRLVSMCSAARQPSEALLTTLQQLLVEDAKAGPASESEARMTDLEARIVLIESNSALGRMKGGR